MSQFQGGNMGREGGQNASPLQVNKFIKAPDLLAPSETPVDTSSDTFSGGGLHIGDMRGEQVGLSEGAAFGLVGEALGQSITQVAKASGKLYMYHLGEVMDTTVSDWLASGKETKGEEWRGELDRVRDENADMSKLPAYKQLQLQEQQREVNAKIKSAENNITGTVLDPFTPPEGALVSPTEANDVGRMWRGQGTPQDALFSELEAKGFTAEGTSTNDIKEILFDHIQKNLSDEDKETWKNSPSLRRSIEDQANVLATRLSIGYAHEREVGKLRVAATNVSNTITNPKNFNQFVPSIKAAQDVLGSKKTSEMFSAVIPSIFKPIMLDSPYNAAYKDLTETEFLRLSSIDKQIMVREYISKELSKPANDGTKDSLWDSLRAKDPVFDKPEYADVDVAIDKIMEGEAGKAVLNELATRESNAITAEAAAREPGQRAAASSNNGVALKIASDSNLNTAYEKTGLPHPGGIPPYLKRPPDPNKTLGDRAEEEEEEKKANKNKSEEPPQ